MLTQPTLQSPARTARRRASSPLAAPLCLSVLLLGLSVLLLAGCAETPPGPALPPLVLEPLPNLSGPGAMAAQVTATEAGVVLSWLEPSPEPDPAAAEEGTVWRLRVSGLFEGAFGEPATVTEGTDFFANWADMPSLAQHPSGPLFVHHLAKLGLGTYAYGAFLHALPIGATSWQDLGLLHDDRSPTEHGFVSYAQDGEELRAFWLDGREMFDGDPMTLRTTILEAGDATSPQPPGEDGGAVPALGPGASELLDARVCECCQTDAATTSEGPVVVYRDRSEDEIRDIRLIRGGAEGFSDPVVVHRDRWRIQACPVNGPAVAAVDELVAVAWFTGADDRPRTHIALSRDAGRSFSDPILLLEGATQGRVDLVATGPAEGGRVDLWVAQLARPSDQEAGPPSILLDHLAVTGEGMQRGSTVTVAGSSEARSAGFPRLAADGDSIVVAWVNGDEPSRIGTARVRLEPAAGD